MERWKNKNEVNPKSQLFEKMEIGLGHNVFQMSQLVPLIEVADFSFQYSNLPLFQYSKETDDV
jgi:hypothetical protein